MFLGVGPLTGVWVATAVMEAYGWSEDLGGGIVMIATWAVIYLAYYAIDSSIADARRARYEARLRSRQRDDDAGT